MQNIDEKLNKTQPRKVIAIVGPTASGKTGIGVRLAKEFDGEIVSADSRQVYRGLDLGTGKDGEPSAAWQLSSINDQLSINYQLKNDQLNDKWKLEIENLRRSIRMFEGVPQWMIDIVEPGTNFNLFDYLPLARVAIKDIFARGKTPIIVGGTGMYVQALIEGFQLEQSLVTSRESIVEHSREQLGQMSREQLNSILAETDPKTYENIDTNNPYRLIRAIERAQSGERAIKIKPDFEVLQIAMDLPREELHGRIDKRVDERFEQGMLEEVVGLINKGVDPEWLVGLGLEYREITNYIVENGKCKMEDGTRTPAFSVMSQQLKYKIHQFVRRQLTWFRRFPEIKWAKDYYEVVHLVKAFLNK